MVMMMSISIATLVSNPGVWESGIRRVDFLSYYYRTVDAMKFLSRKNRLEQDDKRIYTNTMPLTY